MDRIKGIDDTAVKQGIPTNTNSQWEEKFQDNINVYKVIQINMEMIHQNMVSE